MENISAEEYENFRMYHELQYDRIDKLESKREVFSNFAITISTGVYILGFDNIDKLNIFTIIAIPLIVGAINIAAILFANKSRYFVKLHQKRAKIARDKYAPQLNEISNKVEKIDSKKDPFSRNKIYKYLHIILILIAIISSTNYILILI